MYGSFQSNRQSLYWYFFPNLFIDILSVEIYNVNLNTHILVKQVQQYFDKNTTSSEVS